mmetsp:Transcript_4555/g.12397  ORF Transcript_4555/g.12397 Transcript_4555/m.12397 type:complete len:269 (-) Transcript_4555:231-1037(-)
MRSSFRESEALFTAFACPDSSSKLSPVSTFQTRAVASMDAVMTKVPVGENRADFTTSRCPRSTFPRWPLLADQMQAVPSQDAVTMSPLSGEKAADFTSSRCPDKVSKHFPVAPHQTLAVSSSTAPVIQVPSEENMPDCTRGRPSALEHAAPNSHMRSPDSAHHREPSPSREIVRRLLPFGENVADATCPSSCATSIFRQLPLCRDQMRAVPSKEAVRQLSSDWMRKRVSPSHTPASFRLLPSSSNCDWSMKCSAMPNSPMSLSTTSLR